MYCACISGVFEISARYLISKLFEQQFLMQICSVGSGGEEGQFFLILFLQHNLMHIFSMRDKRNFCDLISATYFDADW